MERSRHFETQHRLLLLETLYDAGLSLGAMPDEEALVEDVLARVVGVLDASRGYLATFAEGGARRAEARVGLPRKRPAEAVVAVDEFLREVLESEGAVERSRFKLLGKPVTVGRRRADLGRRAPGRRARPRRQGSPPRWHRPRSTRRTAGSSCRSRGSAAWRSRTGGTSSA